jgi:ApaG protein
MIRPFYYKETRGIRITVRPQYLPDHSQPLQLQYVFAYFVRIENVGKRKVQLLSRRWLIYDSIGEEREVVGDGVVGEQPVLVGGDVHEYHSFCVLKSPYGYMEGSYRFIGLDDVLFETEIPRFILTTDESSWSMS